MAFFKKLIPLVLICAFLVSCGTNDDEPAIYDALTLEYLKDIGLSDFVFPNNEYVSESESMRIYKNCTYDEFVTYLDAVVKNISEREYPIYYTDSDYDTTALYLMTIKNLFVAKSNEDYFLKRFPLHSYMVNYTTEFDITDNTWFEVFYEYSDDFYFISCRYVESNISVNICNTAKRRGFTYMVYY